MVMGHINMQFDEHQREEIKFQLTGTELRKHCTDRAKFHKERQDFFEKKEKEFGKEAEEARRPQQVGIGAGIVSGSLMVGQVIESNRQSMGSQKSNHEHLKVYFRFCAIHLRKKSYELTEGECRKFEIIY
jgi:hypothetical protein